MLPASVRALPDISTLQQRARALAMLDTILCPDAQYRTFLFDPAWSGDEQMAKQEDGSGNDCFLLFAPLGCFIRGFDHESEMSPWAQDPPQVWPGVLSDVPGLFAPMVNEPAFDNEKSITFASGERQRRTAGTTVRCLTRMETQPLTALPICWRPTSKAKSGM